MKGRLLAFVSVLWLWFAGLEGTLVEGSALSGGGARLSRRTDGGSGQAAYRIGGLWWVQIPSPGPRGRLRSAAMAIPCSRPRTHVILPQARRPGGETTNLRHSIAGKSYERTRSGGGQHLLTHPLSSLRCRHDASCTATQPAFRTTRTTINRRTIRTTSTRRIVTTRTAWTTRIVGRSLVAAKPGRAAAVAVSSLGPEHADFDLQRRVRRDAEPGTRIRGAPVRPERVELERVLVERHEALELNATAGGVDDASDIDGHARLGARNVVCPVCPAGASIATGDASGQLPSCCPTRGRMTLVTVLTKIYVYRQLVVRKVRVTKVVARTVRLHQYFGRYATATPSRLRAANSL